LVHGSKSYHLAVSPKNSEFGKNTTRGKDVICKNIGSAGQVESKT
jgi:hypothetical protein